MPQTYASAYTATLDERNEWTECPKCRSVMLPLAEYEILDASEFPSLEADWWEIGFWGWSSVIAGFCVDLVNYYGRKLRLATLKRSNLPRFRHSLVCPRCLFLLRRA